MLPADPRLVHVFLEVRVVAGVTGWERLGDHAIETIVWGCLAFSLLFADVILQLQELLRNRPATARAQTAAGRSAPSAVPSGD